MKQQTHWRTAVLTACCMHRITNKHSNTWGHMGGPAESNESCAYHGPSLLWSSQPYTNLDSQPHAASCRPSRAHNPKVKQSDQSGKERERDRQIHKTCQKQTNCKTTGLTCILQKMDAETCKASLSLTPIVSQFTQRHGDATPYRAKNGC